MFSKILGKKSTDSQDVKNHSQLVEKISNMDLTEKRIYVNNRISSMPVCRDGLLEVLDSLIKLDDKTNTRYLKIDDNDIKIKKGFDLAILIATHNMITFPVIKSLQEFEEVYKDIIEKFDTDNKQTYKSKLKKATENAVLTIGLLADIHNSNDVLNH